MYQQFKRGIEPRDFHAALYGGAIGQFSDLAEMRTVVAKTQSFLENRFAPHAPPEIHRHVDPGALPTLLSAVQRDYSRSNEVKEAWKRLFEAIGFDSTTLARDRLVVRFQPPVEGGEKPNWNRSTATVGFHRDTWGTNLYSQINWWAPVYPITAGRTFAFFPALWNVPLANNSDAFDMEEALRRVREARPDLKAGDLLPQLLESVDPAAAEPVTIEPGTIIAFSAQHAHAGVTNHTEFTRISLDTRTLLLEDYVQRRGAPNVDGRARWMAPGMFRRVSDGISLTEVLGVKTLEAFDGPWPAPATAAGSRDTSRSWRETLWDH